MLYFPKDFGELTIDGLIDTGALSSAIPEMDLRKIRLLSPQSVIREGPPPNFQIMVANGQLETPKSTKELKFEVGDIEFHEIFIVMEHLTGPIIGLMFLQRNHTVLDIRQGILNFPFFSMQLKTADHRYSNVLEPILDPTKDNESRAKFLENFDWKDSTLTPEEKEKIEELLVEFHDIFARQRFDIGMNEEFKVKLTPKDDSPAYSQSLPAPFNLKEDILVELAMLHKYGIITTLPFSKYASPRFKQKKPNGKPRLWVDLRKINNLISDAYINNNHSVSTLVDAAQHLAGKKLFCKLDCSQAYQCLPMADQRSIEMLAFNFASRTFAYRRLAQGLSRALSAFSSFMREYLDKVIKADQCAQYVDDIGIAANDADHLIANLRATFKCIQEAGLKLTMHKCHFGAKEIDFLGQTITPQGVKPQKQIVQNFLEKTKFPKSKKALQRNLGFLNYNRNYVPRLSERLAPFYKMLKSDEKVLVSKELVQQFEEINRALDKCCDLALQQSIPNKQIALMTDASFGAAGYAVLIEDDPNQKFTSLRKSYAPVAYGSKTFNPAQIKMSIYAKELLAIYFAFKEFGHIFWGAPKPFIILTDNKAVTRFFQTKIVLS